MKVKVFTPFLLIVFLCFTCIVANAHAGSPPSAVLDEEIYTGFEGAPITFDASDSTDPDGDQLHYRWDPEGDGYWSGWSITSWFQHSYGDDGTETIWVKVSDGLLTDITMATVIIENVAPQVNAGPDMEAIAGTPARFSGSFNDPGWRDSHTILWEFGDGETANGLKPTHTYEVPGEYMATLTVTDDDGGKGCDTVLVKVIAGAQIGIESCDDAGNPKNEFRYRQELYVKGWGFPDDADIPIYMVVDVNEWVDGLALSSLKWASGTLVRTDSVGNIFPTLLMEPGLPLGDFDIFADINDNEIYDVDVDALDNNNVHTSAGFFVIPELPFGTVASLAASIAGLVIAKKRARRRDPHKFE